MSSPQTEVETEVETQKEPSPPPQHHVNIGQGGPGGGDEEEDDEVALCRICYEGDGAPAGRLLSLCRCKGSMGFTHLACLERWLDAAQKTRCELCGTAYRVQLARRYSALPSIRVWVREEADRRLLLIDLVTVLFVTPLIGAYVFLSVRAILNLSLGPVDIGPNETTTEPLTAAGLMVLCVIVVFCFLTWLAVSISAHVNDWYSWWSTCYRVRVVPAAVGERLRTSVEAAAPLDEVVLRRDSSLERIFSRGVQQAQRGMV